MNFGLICEGETDYPVILHLLAGYYNRRDIDLRQVQPEPREHGGWTRIFSFCESERLQKSLQIYDYLIIQIDTDRRIDIGFDIHEYQTTKDLINKVKQIIISKIGEVIYNKVADKIIFAISVHSIECWFMPFYATNKVEYKKENSCFGAINKILRIKNIKALNKSDIRTYTNVAKPLADHRNFNKRKALQESLHIFSEELDLKAPRNS